MSTCNSFVIKTHILIKAFCNVDYQEHFEIVKSCFVALALTIN